MPSTRRFLRCPACHQLVHDMARFQRQPQLEALVQTFGGRANIKWAHKPITLAQRNLLLRAVQAALDHLKEPPGGG